MDELLMLRRSMVVGLPRSWLPKVLIQAESSTVAGLSARSNNPSDLQLLIAKEALIDPALSATP